jgi:hypothetical protein
VDALEGRIEITKFKWSNSLRAATLGADLFGIDSGRKISATHSRPALKG